MNDGDAILQAILATPGDDAPRLAYADWLDENGDSNRAAFIRVQIKLARLGPGDFNDMGSGITFDDGRDAQRKVLYEREHRLWCCHSFFWFRQFAGAPFCSALNEENACGLPAHGFPTHGFIDFLVCRAQDCINHLDAIRLQQPVRKVRLTTWPQCIADPPHAGNPLFMLVGGRTRVRQLGDGESRANAMARLLAAEWPGITFQLPEVAHVGS